MNAQRFWMVKGSGPSSYHHESLEGAEREAERLAAENPGRIFYVLEAVAAFRKVAVERVSLRPDADDPEIPF